MTVAIFIGFPTAKPQIDDGRNAVHDHIFPAERSIR
jgi:hypothetical protein